MSGRHQGGRGRAASAGTMSVDHDRAGHRPPGSSHRKRLIRRRAIAKARLRKTVSGKVQLELPAGTALETRFKTLSGKVRNPFPAGNDCRLQAMSISGSIELVPS
jgi:hypothetical protein